MIVQCRRHMGIPREGCVWNVGAVLLMIEGELQEIVCCSCLVVETPWSIVVLPVPSSEWQDGKKVSMPAAPQGLVVNGSFRVVIVGVWC